MKGISQKRQKDSKREMRTPAWWRAVYRAVYSEETKDVDQKIPALAFVWIYEAVLDTKN